MKSLGLRRSLNNNNDGDKNGKSNPSQPSPPLPGGQHINNPLSRPSGKVAPPQKVIKALTTHRSTNPQELSYQEGDFWYVTGERDGWYEALNPLTGSRGLVPKTHFEEFMKGGRLPSGAGMKSGGSEAPTSRSHTPTMSQSHQNPYPASISRPQPGPSPPVSATPVSSAALPKNKQPVYAVVQYDFKAERPDELDANKGEAIVVIAQSNHEWFVAKPIGRLGGPGLIPVAFVEMRDPTTGRAIEILPDTIPMVEEWKKATADYKAAAIPLGRFDFNPETSQPVANSPFGTHTRNGSSSQLSQPPSQHQSPSQSIQIMPRTTSASSMGKMNGNGNGAVRPQHNSPDDDAMLPEGEIISLEVPSFHNEADNYWFRIQVIFHSDENTSSAYALSLYRTYEDFYEFQINLLDSFPYEAGRPAKGKEDQSPPERILPYMPGPVDDRIDDELTEYRREELDAYVKALVDLRDRGADYILRHELIRGFFAAKHGDHFQETDRRPDSVEELDERMAGSRISDGRGYEANQSQSQSQRAPSAMSKHSQHSALGVGGGRHMSGGYPATQPGGQSGASQPTHSRQVSRGPSPMTNYASESVASSSTITRPPSDTRQMQPHHQPQLSASSTSAAAARTAAHLSGPLSTATTSSSWGHAPNSAVSAGGGGGGGASGAGGQPPYVKIKIFDRATDDLIAIRVHPNVTYDELSEKVHARLGAVVSALRYKDASMGGGGGYGEIRDDQELRDWMRTEDQKLVLYAER